MKNLVTLACLGCLAMSCKKPASRVPAGEATPPTQVTDHVMDAAVPTKPIMSEAEKAKLIEEIFDEKAVVYSSTSNSIVWADSYHFEGYGDTTVLLREGDQEAKTLAEFPIGSDEFDDQKAAAAAALGVVLAKGDYVQLERFGWEGGDLDLDAIGCALHWDDIHLSISKGSGQAVMLDSYEPSEPHVPRPTAAYAKAGVSVLVVEIIYDPGDQYHDGYTINRMKEVFAIPK